MSETKHLVCPHCDRINRVPPERFADGPRCGTCRQPLLDGHPLELNERNFDRHIEAGGLPVLVDFWAPWCGPCRSMAPVFSAAAAELKTGARFAKVNTEEHPALAARYGIRSIPTLILFRAGQERDRHSGALDRHQLIDWVKRYL